MLVENIASLEKSSRNLQQITEQNDAQQAKIEEQHDTAILELEDAFDAKEEQLLVELETIEEKDQKELEQLLKDGEVIGEAIVEAAVSQIPFSYYWEDSNASKEIDLNNWEKSKSADFVMISKKGLNGKQVVISYDGKAKYNTSQTAGSIPGFVFLRKKTYYCAGQTFRVKEYRHTKTGLEFVEAPTGDSIMGDEEGRDDEKPVHHITIDKFLICKTEVTQKAWQKVMQTTPWKDQDYTKDGDDYPVVHISWYDAKSFCDKTGLSLPTEAQWEYACRAGSRTKYYWGNEIDSEYAWYDKNADDVGEKYAHKVAQKKPNAFGLHDMTGNVAEWCRDWYDEYYYSSSPRKNPPGSSDGWERIYRGGSWFK